jgi:hypothetical protein
MSEQGDPDMSEKKTPTLYPFLTKNQIKERLVNEPEFQKEAMVLLLQFQTDHEQATETTKDRNRQGFMSSHAVNGTRVAKKIVNGEDLSDDDWAKIGAIAPRYSRQLAHYYRAKMLVEQPELRKVAALFSADISES